jgi:hypothetical protein
LLAINQSLAPGGSLLFKDWVISANPIHWLNEMSDRYLTGDDVSYFTMDGINLMLDGVFGPDSIRQVRTVPPWRNNVAFLVEQSQAPFARDAG